MIDMINWRDRCGRALCGFTNAASLLTGPIQMDASSYVSRKCARSRLQNAQRTALVAVRAIENLLVDLEAGSCKPSCSNSSSSSSSPAYSQGSWY